MSRDAEARRPGRTSASRARGERGAVTAEAAVVLPVLVALGIALVWLLSLAVAQVRVVDGAREAARLAARGDTAGARVAAHRVAPEGADLRLSQAGERVSATVVSEFRGPGGLFHALPGVTLRWQADAVREPR